VPLVGGRGIARRLPVSVGFGAFAGVWMPDTEMLASARNYGGFTRRAFLRRRARQACEADTQWCTGDVYGYRLTGGQQIRRLGRWRGLAGFFHGVGREGHTPYPHRGEGRRGAASAASRDESAVGE
jgi:hypothetical protein